MVDREQVPALTTIRLEAKQRDLHDLRKPELFASIAARNLRQQPSSTELKQISSQSVASPSVASRVDANDVLIKATRDFVAGVPEGWEQIEAIQNALKDQFTLDSLAVVPEESTDAVEHFLKVKKGPAYLFATTAAAMVRVLGHQSRVANGFYIDSDTFDVASGQYLIGKKQLHWWPQVSVDGQNWISIEPTPGYEAPPENWTLYQRAQWAWNVSLRWVRNHPWLLAMSFVLIAAAYRCRIQIADFMFAVATRWIGRFSIEHYVAWSLWLIDRRAEFAGFPRPPSKTRRLWFKGMQPQEFRSESCASTSTTRISTIEAIHHVLKAQDEMLYSPGRMGAKKAVPLTCDQENLRSAVDALLQSWTVRQIRAAHEQKQTTALKRDKSIEYSRNYATIH
jgi:hypothetical protein